MLQSPSISLPRCTRLLPRSVRATTGLPSISVLRSFSISKTAQYAAVAVKSLAAFRLPDDYVPPTQPPSARPPDTRKSQLIRTYTSLLRSTPAILFFQHNNLTAVEWAAIRRELRAALEEVSSTTMVGDTKSLADINSQIQFQVLRTRMFLVAMKIVDLFNAESAATLATTPRLPNKEPLAHDLSSVAYDTLKNAKVPDDSLFAQIEPLLVGPLAALVLPELSPAHLEAALRVLSPSSPHLTAPSRKKRPGYHDALCQNALAKLLLVGARIDGRVFDPTGIADVARIEGDLTFLRARLVNVLHGAGLGLTTTLEGASKSLWVTMESRRISMEEEQQNVRKDM
jgi:large subunit ribosomal protein L10